MGGARRPWLALAAIMALGLIRQTAPAQLFPVEPMRPAPRTSGTVYLDTNDPASKQLHTAAHHVANGQWAEALELYQKVMETSGDKVTRLGGSGNQETGADAVALYVSIRAYCQIQISTLPPEALALYRRRIDPQAETWFRRGLQGDPAALKQVVAQAFNSSWGDKAVDLLADAAFEQGDPDEALALWQQIVPDQTGPRPPLVYPGTSLDRAAIAAKKVLCLAFMGDRAQAARRLAEFATAYPGARGRLAGRDGPYRATLAAVLQTPDLGSVRAAGDQWPTFAGAQTRSRVVPTAIDVGSFQWSAPLEEPTHGDQQYGMYRVAPGFRANDERLLAYYPVVVGNRVIVANEREVTAYDLQTGPQPGKDPRFSLIQANPGFGQPQYMIPFYGVDRYTLTAHGDRLYVRMGSQVTSNSMFPRTGMRTNSVLVCLDLSKDLKELWEIDLHDEPDLAFEGSPVADDQNVYIAMTKGGALRQALVACYDAETHQRKWTRMICESPSADVTMWSSSLSHHLLTLGGRTVYYQTSLGAIGALDAATGGIKWIATYPRHLPGMIQTPAVTQRRTLSPAVYAQGLVLAAPEDSDRIFAFDAQTGQLRWTSRPLPQVNHLLGVAKGHLVATGNNVWLIDLQTGRVDHTWPEAGGTTPSFGRGVLAGDCIFWPLKDRIEVLAQETGLRVRPPIPMINRRDPAPPHAGNLVIGGGYLVVAQSKTLIAYCQYSRLLERHQAEIAAHPRDPIPHFELARAAEGADDLIRALDEYRAARRLARPDELFHHHPLEPELTQRLAALLNRLARGAAAQRHWDRAIEWYAEARPLAAAPAERLRIELRLAEAQCAADRLGQGLATYQAVLARPELRALTAPMDDPDAEPNAGLQGSEAVHGHRSIRADLLVAARVAEILQTRGRAAYAPFDAQAEILLERGLKDQSPEPLRKLVRLYPNARAAPRALLSLAQTAARRHDWEAAARTYQQVMDHDAAGKLGPLALAGLARVYEEQQLYDLARDTWQRLAANHAAASLKAVGIDQPAGAYVAAHLARPPYLRLSGSGGAESVSLPLVRSWTRRFNQASHVLTVEGAAAHSAAAPILLASDRTLEAVAGATGRKLWSVSLSAAPTWAARHPEHLLVGTAHSLLALNPATGAIEWRYDVDPRSAGTPFETRSAQGPAPAVRWRPLAEPAPPPQRFRRRFGFGHPPIQVLAARLEPATPAVLAPSVSAPALLHDFRLVGSRVFCMEGSFSLQALDVDTGQVQWQVAPPRGEFWPGAYYGSNQVLVQYGTPARIQVLDAADGAVRYQIDRPEGSWVQTPVGFDAERVVLTKDNRTLELFNLRTGTVEWTFRGPWTASTAPAVLADGRRLMAIFSGYELIRIDPATGRELWRRPLGTEALERAGLTTALDDERFYCVTQQNLRAFRLRDGAPVWQRYLIGPDGPWQVSLRGSFVAAYPVHPGSNEPTPLVFCRRDSGALVERIAISVQGKDTQARLGHRVSLLGSESELWAFVPIRDAEHHESRTETTSRGSMGAGRDPGPVHPGFQPPAAASRPLPRSTDLCLRLNVRTAAP